MIGQPGAVLEKTPGAEFDKGRNVTGVLGVDMLLREEKRSLNLLKWRS